MKARHTSQSTRTISLQVYRLSSITASDGGAVRHSELLILDSACTFDLFIQLSVYMCGTCDQYFHASDFISDFYN